MEREIVNKKAGGCLKTGSMCGEKKTILIFNHE